MQGEPLLSHNEQLVKQHSQARALRQYQLKRERVVEMRSDLVELFPDMEQETKKPKVWMKVSYDDDPWKFLESLHYEYGQRKKQIRFLRMNTS
jgi:hypothetical protein